MAARMGSDPYQAQDDARTLTQAEAIHSDPKRVDGVKKHLKHAAKALSRVSSKMASRKSSRK